MKHSCLMLVLLLSGISFGGSKERPTELAQVLRHPEKYNGKVIEVVGYVTVEFEGNALYVDQAAQKNSVYEKSVWLEIAKSPYENKTLNGTRVVVSGKFNMSNKGHLGMWKGAIEKVSELRLVEK